MKRLLILSTAILIANVAGAQPWLDNSSNKPIKLDDVIAAHDALEMKKAAAKGTEEKESAEEEGKQYHWGRWLWYWKDRVDENGYLVSPVEKVKAWKKWEAINKGRRAAAKSTALSPNASWTFQGPASHPGGSRGVGRINILTFHPTDTNTYMVGTPGGGIWRTTDDAATWESLSDDFPVMGIADIDYNPLNPNTIYACTGDRPTSDTYSMGVLKSTDGGNTWDTTGFSWSFSTLKKTNALVVHPTDTAKLALATSDGFYTSDDAGATWTLKQAGNIKQMVGHPNIPSLLLATGRISNGSYQVYRSEDFGDTWTITSNFPANVRAEIAVTKADSRIVKVVTANAQYGLEGVYNSIDSGKTFSKIMDDGTNCSTNILDNRWQGNTCGGQGWYDLSIAISPVDAKLVFVGGVYTFYSTDGGSSFRPAGRTTNTMPGTSTIHVDKHYHKFNPYKPTELFECNDGGLYRSSNPTASNAIWSIAYNGLGITQFYRNAVSNVASFVLGGAQDNGTTMIENDGSLDNMTGGDGMDCQLDPIDSNVIYTSIQYGELRRSTNRGNNFTDIQNNISGRPQGNWITPFVLLPNAPTNILAGFNYLYHSTDRGSTWQAITGQLSANIDRIAVTEKDDNYIYLIINRLIYYTKDFGKNWSSQIVPYNVDVSDIAIDPRDKDIVWLTFRTYTGVKVASFDNRTKQFNEFKNNLPDVPVNCVAIDSKYFVMYVGTDLGVYYRRMDQADWDIFDNNSSLPNVEVFDLGINQTTEEIWAATYGRSMWKSPVHKLGLSVSNMIPYANDVVTIAPNPNTGNFNMITNNSELKNKTVETSILNYTGAVVWKKTMTIDGSGKAAINADLPNGTYIVEMHKDGVRLTKAKMVVLN